MRQPEVEAFLTDLVVQQRVAVSTQNQALSALLFLSAAYAPGNRSGCRPCSHAMSGVHQLMAELLYGNGLRLIECVQLCVKDLKDVTKPASTCAPKYTNSHSRLRGLRALRALRG
jgi:integrase